MFEQINNLRNETLKQSNILYKQKRIKTFSASRKNTQKMGKCFDNSVKY